MSIHRRHFLALTAVPLAVGAVALSAKSSTGSVLLANTEDGGSADLEFDKLDWPKSKWRELLSEPAYHVLFEDGTERPGSSPLNNEKRDGHFICAACYLPLFTADTKYDSGTGWPSFFNYIEGRLGTSKDYKLIRPRTEYHCARCGGHQGHVFKDGPKPTGLRYCNNGVALRFVPEGEELPALRT